MSWRLKKLGVLTASLVLGTATGQIAGAEVRHVSTERFLPVSFSGHAAAQRPSPRLSGPVGVSPSAYDAFAFAEQRLDEQAPSQQYSVRLYPIEDGGRSAGSAEGAPVLRSAPLSRGDGSAAQGERLAAAKKTSLPEPNDWAVLLAGLLGVGAIARRRMPG